jgi:protein-S-isoprenylcysteine O-methyltransferase Ste14
MVSGSIYENRFLIGYGNFIFRYRNKVFPVVLIILLVIFHPPFEMEAWNEFLLDVAALLVALSGEALRIATVGLEYIKRGGLNKRIYANNLVTQGMFSHCRNPLYLGNVLIALALLSFGDRVDLFLVGSVLVILTYISIIAAEEKFLLAKFGDEYADYCRQVPRWIPNVRGMRATMRGMTFNWRRVLLKELSSFYAWIAIATVINIAHAWNYKLHMPPQLQPDTVLFLSLFAVLTLALIIVRWLKHSHRLKM